MSEQVIFHVVGKLGIMIMWLWFTLFHVAALLALLGAVWWFQVPPAQAKAFLLWLYRSAPVHWLSITGIGALAAISLYVKAWRIAFARATAGWIVKGLDE